MLNNLPLLNDIDMMAYSIFDMPPIDVDKALADEQRIIADFVDELYDRKVDNDLSDSYESIDDV